MATAVGDLVVRLGAQTRGFDSRMRRSTGAVRVMTGAVYGLGTAIATALGPVVGIYGLIRLTKAGETFNQKMRQSLAIMGDVSDAMKNDMRAAAFEVARSTKYSASEVAEAFYFLASAGLSAKQSIVALPEVATFAQAGMFDLARATELVVGAQAAMGLKSADAAQNLQNLTRVGDVLVKANTLAQASVEQFAVALGNDAANAGRMAGQSVEDVVAVLAAFAEKMVVGEQAGSAYARAINYLSIQATENVAAFKRAGVAMFDQAGGTRKLVDVIEDLEKRFEGMSHKERTLEFQQLGFTKKTIALMNTLVGTSASIRKFREELGDAGGTMQEVADNQLTRLQKGWAQLGATFTQVGSDILITIGPMLETAMTAVANYVTGAWETIKFGVQNAGDLAKLALVELALKVLQLVPLIETPLGKVAEVFAGVFSGIGAFARTIIDNIIGGFKELMNVAKAVGAAITEGFRAIKEGDLRNAGKRMADTFIETFAKQQNVQAPNAFKEFHKAYNDAAGKVRSKFARAGGPKAALEEERRRLLAQIAGRDIKGGAALDVAAGAGPAAVAAPGLPSAGAGGKMFGGAVEARSKEAWDRITTAMGGGGKKGPEEKTAKNTDAMAKDLAEAVQIWKRNEERGFDLTEIPA